MSNENPQNKDNAEFLAQFSRTTPERERVHAPTDKELSSEELLKKYTLPKKESVPRLSEEEIRESKRKAGLLEQSVSVLQTLCKENASSPSIKLSVDTSNDKTAMRLSVSGGEMDSATFNALQRTVSDCNEIKTIDNSRFADLFPGSENRGISPESLLLSLRNFLTGVQEEH
jgi:hypothetical protein